MYLTGAEHWKHKGVEKQESQICGSGSQQLTNWTRNENLLLW